METIKRKKTSIELRVTEEEKKMFRKKAKALGYYSLSKYIRDIVLNSEGIKPKSDIELIIQVRKIGVNLNQISALCNLHKTDKILIDLSAEIKNEIRILNDIISKI